MALETGTYIDDLVATNPLSSDPRSAGDDHIRLIKAVLKATFPNITGALTPTQTELNYVDGVTSAIQTQINTINTNKPTMPIGTTTIFYQATAPTGWAQHTTSGYSNVSLRVVNGAGGGTGGSVNFTSALALHTVTGTVAGHALTIAEMPSHTHTSGKTGGANVAAGGNAITTADLLNVSASSTGGGATHSHGFTGGNLDLRVKYLDVVMAHRDT